MTERLDYLSDEHLAELRAHRLRLFMEASDRLDIARNSLPNRLSHAVLELERVRNDAHLEFETAAREVERRYIESYKKDNQS